MIRFGVLCGALMLVTGASGCGELDDESEDAEETAEPPAVAPVEVVAVPGTETAAAADPAAPEDTVESLRARVSELETELAACQGATVPEGVEVPGEEHAATTPATARPATAGSTDSDNSDDHTRRRGLVDTLLGDNPRNDEEELLGPLPNPSDILFGQ